MKGDFTRNTFDPRKHFSRVLMQQGRVQLDADFNEQASILLHYLRTMMTDLIGPYGGPAGFYGFKIGQISNNDFSIGPGRYYVDGILSENDRSDLTYQGQRGFSEKDKLDNNKRYFVYLDVWERHITCVQNDDIRDKALGGPDTCSRAEVVWQVKAQEVEEYIRSLEKQEQEKDVHQIVKDNAATNERREPVEKFRKLRPCEQASLFVRKLPKHGSGTMAVRIQPVSGEPDECTVLPEARYKGAENQLYRIEVHRAGGAWNGVVDTKSGTPTVNAAQEATFKWSRDNGSVVFPIVEQKGETFILQSLGRDERTSLKVGDLVEIMDDDKEIRCQPGIMAEVTIVRSGDMSVTLKALADSSPWPAYKEESPNHPLLRRWDHRVKEGITMSEGAILITESNADWIEIEDGIEIQFKPDGQYRTGDYWLISARAATGKIEWPNELGTDGKEKTLALPPHGIEHHHAPLAVINVDSKGNIILVEKGDCRCPFKAPCATRE
jgi:hypothetical protein